MVAELSLPYNIKLVDVYRRRFIGNIYWISNGKFSGNKSGNGESCNEFENGIENVLTMINQIIWLSWLRQKILKSLNHINTNSDNVQKLF